MPNKGHVWTPEEEQAALDLTWEEFDAKYNGSSGLDISFDAYRLRKGLLRRGVIKPQGPIEAVDIPASDQSEFVGIKTAFWDIETTFSTQPRMLYGCIADNWGNVEHFSLLDDRYKGRDWLDDSVLVDKYARRVEQFQHSVTWNGRLFDVPTVNGRLNYWRVQRERGAPVRDDLLLRPLDIPTHTDAMYLASGQFNRIGRRSLESVSKFFNSPNRKTPLDVRTWDLADHGDEDAYNLIGEHCAADVLVLRDVFSYLQPHVRNIHR